MADDPHDNLLRMLEANEELGRTAAEASLLIEQLEARIVELEADVREHEVLKHWREERIAWWLRRYDELSDRLDMINLEHEVTKGYRQHAEQERDALQDALDRIFKAQDADKDLWNVIQAARLVRE